MSIELTWVQLGRMNPKPNSTNSARVNEWIKEWVLYSLHACDVREKSLDLG